MDYRESRRFARRETLMCEKGRECEIKRMSEKALGRLNGPPSSLTGNSGGGNTGCCMVLPWRGGRLCGRSEALRPKPRPITTKNLQNVVTGRIGPFILLALFESGSDWAFAKPRVMDAYAFIALPPPPAAFAPIMTLVGAVGQGLCSRPDDRLVYQARMVF